VARWRPRLQSSPFLVADSERGSAYAFREERSRDEEDGFTAPARSGYGTEVVSPLIYEDGQENASCVFQGIGLSFRHLANGRMIDQAFVQVDAW
jgi:hypothetical protein